MRQKQKTRDNSNKAYMRSNNYKTILRHGEDWFYLCLCIVIAVMLPSACAEQEGWEDDDVRINLAMTVSTTHQNENVTRMVRDMIQLDGTGYRGIQDLYAIPYTVQREILATDDPTLARISSVPYVATSSYYYHGGSYYVAPGTASFLCYARAVPEEQKYRNGSIVTTAFDKDRIKTSDIKFSPEPIYGSTSVPAGATALANYMTDIAKVAVDGQAWAATSDANLKLLYEIFINEGKLMAGSYKNVKAFVKELKNGVEKQPASDMKTAILDAIGDVEAKIAANYADGVDYPASIGLPDGAAVVRWNTTSKEFEPQTLTTTVANINRIDRIVYPAELYYYANSQINTSNKPVTNNQYLGKTWEEVKNLYEHKEAAVTSNTQAAVIIEPISYAVGCLQARVRAMSSTLEDSIGQIITVGANTFPLTGIIIGGQYAQRFNFEPDNDDLTEYFIYDHDLPAIKLSTTPSTDFFTLTFQSKETDTPIRLALEFENNSDTDFMGLNGIVYRGTKFYLVGTVARPDTRTEDFENRVFTKDYITQTDMQVKSLAKAYNVVPDLMDARLELGVQLTTDWIQATNSGVVLK